MRLLSIESLPNPSVRAVTVQIEREEARHLVNWIAAQKPALGALERYWGDQPVTDVHEFALGLRRAFGFSTSAAAV